MRALAFGAHPDDVDLYAGGLVASLVARGVEVSLVDLTAGEMATRGSPELRAEEAAEAARILGATSRECLGFPDGGVRADDPEQMRAIVESMRRYRPSLILAPHEVDLHPDHPQTARLVERARFFARLQRFPADGEPCRPGPILSYEQKIPFDPDLIVDIGAARDKKQQAIRAFASQFFRDPDDPLKTEISDPEFHEMLAARSRAHGARIGVTWGEAYKRAEPDAVLDPLRLVREEASDRDRGAASSSADGASR